MRLPDLKEQLEAQGFHVTYLINPALLSPGFVQRDDPEADYKDAGSELLINGVILIKRHPDKDAFCVRCLSEMPDGTWLSDADRLRHPHTAGDAILLVQLFLAPQAGIRKAV